MKKLDGKIKRIESLNKEIANFEKETLIERFYIVESPYQTTKRNEGMENINTVFVSKKNPQEHFEKMFLLENYEECFDIEMDEDEYDEKELKKWEIDTLDYINEKYHLSEKTIEFYEELAKEAYTIGSQEEDNIVDRGGLDDADRHKPVAGNELDDDEQEEWIKDTVVKKFARHEKDGSVKG